MKLILKISCLLLLISNFTYAETSQVGDGSKYYCDSEIDGDYMIISLIRVDNGNDVYFSKALRNIKSKIRSLRAKVKRRPELRPQLDLLVLTRADIMNCYYDGTTGKPIGSVTPPDSGNPPVSADLACQVAGDSARHKARIIGGSQCSIGNSPVVYLELYDSRGSSAGACTGTVVKNSSQNYGRVVVFAAHCAEGVSRVVAVTSNGEYSTTNLSYHPDWGNGAATEDSDVAIAIFNQDFPTRSVRLSSAQSQVGEQGIIAGYGVDENDFASANRLKAGLVSIVENSGFGIAIQYNGGSSANTCFGDSGGPLFINRSGEWLLAGVTSNGVRNDCGVGDTSYFANIVSSKNRSWLNSKVPGLLN